MEFIIVEIHPDDKLQIASFVSENWGSQMIVSKGKKYDTVELSGFICRKEDEIIGMITYNVCGEECEVITLDSKVNNLGLGTQLLNKVIEKSLSIGCKRVWLTTTNDNLNAIRFYQKRAFEWIEFRKDAILQSRMLKPEIPESGYNDIPIRHEIEFEFLLGNKSDI